MSNIRIVQATRDQATQVGTGYGIRIGAPLGNIGPAALVGVNGMFGAEFPVTIRRVSREDGTTDEFVLHAPRTIVRTDALADWYVIPNLGSGMPFASGSLCTPGYYAPNAAGGTLAPFAVSTPRYEVESFTTVEDAVATAALDPAHGVVLAARWNGGSASVPAAPAGNLSRIVLALPTSGAQEVVLNIAGVGVINGGVLANVALSPLCLNMGGYVAGRSLSVSVAGSTAGAAAILLSRAQAGQSPGVAIALDHFLAEFLHVDVTCKFPGAAADFVNANTLEVSAFARY